MGKTNEHNEKGGLEKLWSNKTMKLAGKGNDVEWTSYCMN